jgi:hypothetical protein
MILFGMADEIRRHGPGDFDRDGGKARSLTRLLLRQHVAALSKRQANE